MKSTQLLYSSLNIMALALRAGNDDRVLAFNTIPDELQPEESEESYAEDLIDFPLNKMLGRIINDPHPHIEEICSKLDSIRAEIIDEGDQTVSA